MGEREGNTDMERERDGEMERQIRDVTDAHR